MAFVLVVDDMASSAQYMRLVLEEEGHLVRVAGNGVEALAALEERLPDLVVTDLEMPELDGLGLLTRVRARWPEVPVILVSVQEEIPTVVEAIRKGALNYLIKPCSPETILQAIGKALVPRDEPQATPEEALAGIRGTSPAIDEVRQLVLLAARSDVNVLITGETGTGKEVVSRAIHRASKLAERPFVAQNCAATPPELFESEFFGFKKGAFTGAGRDQAGLLEAADGGVLFLDELSSMHVLHQAKLLRVMDDGELRRLGEETLRRVAVRYLAAVNRPPDELIASGELREDLYYRLRGIEIHLPPLRQRRTDVPELVRHFLGTDGGELTEPALEALCAHDWPGNVRQLKNAILGARALADGQPIDVRHLNLRSAEAGPAAADDGTEAELRTLKEIELDAIRRTLAACDGNQSRAARALGIGRSTLRRKLEG